MIGDLLGGAGLLLATLSAAATLVFPVSQRRSAAMLVALALIPVLILGDHWNSAQIADLRDDPARFAALAAAALAIVAALATLFRRHPVLLPLAIVAALPFRIPLHAGGDQANLLVPLYLVIAGGVIAAILVDTGSRSARRPGLLPKVLATVVVLYALQAFYSEDFSKAVQNAAFFYVPFALAFTLLADCHWDRRLLLASVGVIGAEALVFVLFGFWEYGARHLIWNEEVIRSNDFHTYFRVNSFFWDPNVYGRYLALTVTVISAALLWVRQPRTVAALGVAIALLLLGLFTTFSQSSFTALLAGLATLAALRWSLRWTLLACAAGLLAAAAFVLAAGGSLKIDVSTEHKLNKESTGRANLISEGVALFWDRPVWGYGSGSFSAAFQQHQKDRKARLSVSHTEPITVAAEQGVIGLAAYLALLWAAFATLLRRLGATMPGLRGPPSPASLADDQLVLVAARAAILAGFIVLLTHTMAYAGFLEDPLTWVVLSIGASLAAVGPGADLERRSEPGTPATEAVRAPA